MAAVQFTISNVSVTPSSGYIAAGEAIAVSFRINNTGGFAIHKFDVSLVSGWGASYLFLGEIFSQGSIAIAKGKSHVVSFTAIVPEVPAGGGHIVDGVEASVWCWTHADYGPGDTTYDNVRAPMPFFALDMRYRPQILELSAARTPDEEATDAAVRLRAALAPGANAAYEGLRLTLRWREHAAADFPPANAVEIGMAALGPAGALVVPAFAFEAGKAYVLRATFTDGVDSALSEVVLSKSFAVLDISPDGYGVGIGQYATGTAPDPKLESAYPAHFYAGIRQLDHSTDRTYTGARWIDGKPIYRKVLQFAFSGSTTLTTLSLGDSIEMLVVLRGVYVLTGGSAIPIPRAHNSAMASQVDLYATNIGGASNVGVRRGSSVGDGSGCVIVEYTLAG